MGDSSSSTRPPRPHSKTRTLRSGAPQSTATHACILLHGRHDTPEGVLARFVSPLYTHPEAHLKLITIVPQAENFSWWPYSSLQHPVANQPFLKAAVERVHSIIQELQDNGIGSERVVIGGFSQGAYLTAQYTLSHPKKFGGLFIVAGGLPGHDDMKWDVEGKEGLLDGTKVFLAGGEEDEYIPSRRLDDTQTVLEKLGGKLDCRRYSGLGHELNKDEEECVEHLIRDFLNQI